MSSIRSLVWEDGAIVGECPIDELDVNLANPRRLVWLDIAEPEQQHFAKLAEELQLDAHAVEDAVAPAERAKAARYADHTFITVYTTRLDADPPHDAADDDPTESRLVVRRISAFVLPRGLITVHLDADVDIDAIVRTWDENSALVRRSGVGALVHGMLDVIVDSDFVTIQQIDDAMDTLEDQLFDSVHKPFLIQQRLYRIRKEIVELRRVVLPMRDVVNTIERHRREDEDDTRVLDPYYDDLMDHVLRASEWTDRCAT